MNYLAVAYDLFRLDVLRNKQIVVSLTFGLLFVWLTVLTYLMIWRPRSKESQKIAKEESFARASLRFMPYLMIIVFVGTACLGILFLVTAIIYTPNW